jgi:tetratricopeptide (TPR) repeat protein
MDSFASAVQLLGRNGGMSGHVKGMDQERERASAASDNPAPATSSDTAMAPADGRYQFLDEIARGGMGVVYRATDTALGREVAVKVLSDRFGPRSAAARRFADEARIAAQLQHPSVPPVHDLGALPDRRPFLAMKLIKGQTLEALLAARPDPAHDRGRFVAVFEQVCQALAYAHAHQVIHRDLKPANIMVGAFGEVQVMDWGLAKVLTSRDCQRPEADPQETSAETEVRALRDSDGPLTEAGSVLGTPAFMPPEQAVGAISTVNAHSDVFGLGAVLAVILTGKPPFVASSSETTRIKAAQGQVQDCFARLDDCGADPGLVELCKRCLAPKQEDRPADAGEVARAVAELRQAADDRARQAALERVRAEGERAEAEARAVEQRKRRRVQVALVAALALLLLVGAAFAWWQDRLAGERRAAQARNGQQVEALLDRCEAALQKDNTAGARLALGDAEKRAENPGADHLKERLARCRLAADVLADLDWIDDLRWATRDGKFQGSERTVSEWPGAFARIGVVVGQTPPEQAARVVNGSLVCDQLLAALDRWLVVALPADRAALAAILAAADVDPYRDEVRAAVQRSDWEAVAALAAKDEAVRQPARFAVALGSIPAVPEEQRLAILGAAARARPWDFAVLMTAGHTYKINEPKSAPERIAWLRGAVIVRPKSAVAHNSLGNALSDKGDKDGAEAEYREAIGLDPMYAHPHNNLGNALRDRGDLDGAIAEYHQAIQLNTKYTSAHNNLGVALHRKGDFDGAMAAFKKAIDLDPNYAWPHNNLGLALHCKGDPDGAMAAYREAIRLNCKFARPHNNIGWLLQQKGDLDEATAKFKEALVLDPNYTTAQDNLAETERMLALLPRLPGVLAGRTEPETPDEICGFAYLCAQPFQKQYAVAVRLYDRAFTADPKLADDLKGGHRYKAAHAAALAAAGAGQAAGRLTADERSALRMKALGWLRADLALRKPRAARTAAARSKIAVELWPWLSDTDLAGTRPGAGRDGWAKGEMAEWDTFWSDVKGTLAEATRPSPTSAPPDK